jgi:hypothetical protein
MATKTTATAPAKPTAVAKPQVSKPAVKKATVAAKSKPAAQQPAKPVAPKVAVPKAALPKAEPIKLKKPKLVRDSFTIPKDEYAVIDTLKLRAGKLGQSVKKSELLRAGIKAIASMSDIQFKAALSNVPTLKTGRPKDVK